MNGEHLIMSHKERLRLQVLARLTAKEITLEEAATLMHISYRQARRIYKRYREQGDKGIIHQNRGRASNRRKPEWFRNKVLKRYQERYYDFGPTLATEKLADDGLKVNRETLRLWFLDEGLWQPKKKRMKHRKRRPRKAHFGEMVQLDGSHHDWFEDRAGRCTLMNMVDDATGITMSLIGDGETVVSAMTILKKWIEKYGVPYALYTDKHSIYKLKDSSYLSKLSKGEDPHTQFSRACKELGIKLIYSHSPQAKGRVERKNGVLQDRLVKELRLNGIDHFEEANRFLEEEYMPLFNQRFSVLPQEPADFHRILNEDIDLDKVFSICKTRLVSKDWTVRWNNRVFQIIHQTNLPPAKSHVEVREQFDGQLFIFYRGQEVEYTSWKPVKAKKKEPIKLPRFKKHPLRKGKSPPDVSNEQLLIALGEQYEEEEWMLPY